MHSARIRTLHEVHISSKVKASLICTLVVTGLSACQKTPTDPGEVTRALQLAAIDTVRKNLRDGQQGQFRNLKTYNHQGVAVVCGEVDATNGIGGSSGFASFIYYGDTGRYLIQHPVFPREFEAYRAACTDAPGKNPFARPR